MKKITSLVQEEDGAAEMLQAIIILGLAALIVASLIVISYTVENWAEDRVEVILLDDQKPETVDGSFRPPEWTDPKNL